MDALNGQRLYQQIRLDMHAAQKASNQTATETLKSMIARIDNAYAVVIRPTQANTSHVIAGATSGLGSTEVSRKILTDGDVRQLIQAEICERDDACRNLRHSGQDEYVARLRESIALLRKYIS